MAGFLLTGGSEGCPPTEAPPAGYENPFRFDASGRLWIASCFKGFHFLGSARHDLDTPTTLGSSPGAPVSAAGDIISGASAAAGTYTNLTINNDSACTIAILLGIDMFVDIEARADNLAKWVISARWNGEHKALNSCSSVKIAGSTALVRTQVGASANPFDVAAEAASATANVGSLSPTITLAPGQSGQVSAKMFLQYPVGTPTGTETVYAAYSAIRTYGYVI